MFVCTCFECSAMIVQIFLTKNKQKDLKYKDADRNNCIKHQQMFVFSLSCFKPLLKQSNFKFVLLFSISKPIRNGSEFFWFDFVQEQKWSTFE